MKRIKEFEKYKKKQTLHEIYQKSGIRFAFMSAPKDGNLQSTPWVKCRDYLHDAFRAFIHKNSCSIHGFSYDYKTDPPIDTRRIRMLVKSANKKEVDFKKDIINGVKLINHYEKLANIKHHTKRYQIESGIWIVNGPNFWLKSPALTSMFTFLIRLGENRIEFNSTEDLENKLESISNAAGGNDEKYLCKTFDKMSIIAKYYNTIFLQGKKYEKCIIKKKIEIPIGVYHNNMGILSLCNGSYGYSPSYTNLKAVLAKIEQEKIKKKDEKAINKKKQLIRIKTPYHKDIYENYDASSFYMSTISSPEMGRKQCFQFTSCKELLFASIRAALSENIDVKTIAFPLRSIGGPPIDNMKTRLLITVGGVDKGNGKINKVKNELFFAKKVLNKYEKQFNIEQSLISTVKLEHKEGLSTAWLFTGSKEWISNPVLFGIYILIIRSAKTAASTIGTIDNLTMPKLFNYWKKFYKYVGDKNTDTVLYKSYAEIDRIVHLREGFLDNNMASSYFADNGELTSKYYKKIGAISLLKGEHIDDKLVEKATKLGII